MFQFGTTNIYLTTMLSCHGWRLVYIFKKGWKTMCLKFPTLVGCAGIIVNNKIGWNFLELNIKHG